MSLDLDREHDVEELRRIAHALEAQNRILLDVIAQKSREIDRLRGKIWDRPTRFVEDARIPLDNNATERAIRGPVVGRKNHYGSKSRRGTQVAATMYTILETARLHDIDPAKYLDAALTVADQGAALTPWAFA